ncbi:MAG: squalene/phytoene synthase family protein [Phycisphaerales bacterium JB059]
MSGWESIAARWRRSHEVTPVAGGVEAHETLKSFDHCLNWAGREARPILTAVKPVGGPRRLAWLALLAWRRSVRETIDGNWPVEARQQNLTRLRDQTERALAGAPPRHADPMWPAFSASMCSYAIDPAWVLSALDEMAGDLEVRTHQTGAELKRSAVAGWGSLGIITLAIGGLAPNADAHEAARAARRWGAAMRVVGVLRNFARDFDATPRRVHLPAESFEEHGLTAFKLRAWSESERCAAFVRRWAQGARSAEERAADLAPLMAPDAGRAVLNLTQLAMGVLDELDRDPSRIVRGGRIDGPTSGASRVGVKARLGKKGGRGRGRGRP